MADLPALATIEALEARLGRGVLVEPQRAQALAALADASELVRGETGRTWVTEPGGTVSAPAVVVTITLQAALRVVRNPDGYSSETEDGYTYRRPESELGLYLTDAEILVLSRYAGQSQLHVQRVTREGRNEPYYLYDQFGGDPFLVADGDHGGPW